MRVHNWMAVLQLVHSDTGHTGNPPRISVSIACAISYAMILLQSTPAVVPITGRIRMVTVPLGLSRKQAVADMQAAA